MSDEYRRSDKPTASDSGRKPKVLVVDDDSFVLRFSSTLLGRYGYKVITAENAEQAIRLLRGDDIHAEGIDAVVSDLNMPGMNGGDLLGYVAQNHPEAGRILVSGYDADSIDPSQKIYAQTILQKPYSSTATLIEAIEAVIAGR